MSLAKKRVSDLVGRKFNRLTVTKYLGKRSHGKHWWACECDCGGYVELNTSRLTGNSPTISCGCFRKETLTSNRADPTKHGLHKHKLYGIYYGMLGRCYNPKNCRYQYYGQLGVQVCQEWRDSFLTFYDWATSNGWSDSLSIDRLDASGNYYPSNCEWVSVSENSRRMNVRRKKRKIQQTK
jgi:hypothetical protein